MNTYSLNQLRPESLTVVVVDVVGQEKPNILLSKAAEHLLEDHEHKVLFLVTEEMPLTIGQRFVRYYPDVKSSRIKVSDFHIGLTPVIPDQYTMLIIDDNGRDETVDTFVNKVLSYTPNIKVVRSNGCKYEM
jgi:hypothetical protein